MIDIHAHIMPGVDDGASNMEEMLAMAELAYKSGVTTIVVTPHSNVPGSYKNYDSPEWRKCFSRMQECLKEHHCKIKLVPGAEIYVTENVADKIRSKAVKSINESRYHLMEIPFDADPYWAEAVWDSVLDIGAVPVIAHPERYYCVQERPSFLYEWIQQGCLAQMNKGSILGRFGRRVKRTSEILLDHNLITCVASDAHSPYVRTTFMADIRDYLLDMYGEEVMERLLYQNPDRIVKNLPVLHRHPIRPGRGFGSTF